MKRDSFHNNEDTRLTRLLCLCARPAGHPAMYERLKQQAALISSWEKLPHMAEQHGLAPLVYHHLPRAGIDIPTSVNRILKGAYLTHRHANRERMAALKEIAAAYHNADIEMLALKGAALANTTYPGIALRCMCDLDLMVTDDQADAARNTLKTIGFDIHETATIQPRPFSHHFPPAVRRRNGVDVVVELHHHLYSVSKLVPSILIDKLLPNAISFNVGKTEVKTLAPEEMLRHGYIHAVGKMQLVEQFRLIHVADLIGLVETYADRIDWARFKREHSKTFNALSMLHLFSPWPDLVKKSLPFSADASFGFNHFPKLPSAMGVSSRNRKAWIPLFIKDMILPPDWWVCFFQGNDPARFNVVNHRVAYPMDRLVAFGGNLTGFYIRKGYRRWKSRFSN